jgi:tetratricopeptide (TPR) repeat protein
MPANLRFVMLAFCLLAVTTRAQQTTLEPKQPVEREISGGESHTYQINLTAGQFVRVRLEQQTLDSTLILTAPDDKQIAEVNFTRGGEAEQIAFEALLPGSYLITVRGIGTAGMRGAYRIEASTKASATAQDRKYLAAQTLLIESDELAKRWPATAAEVLEKLEKALPLWQELDMPYWIGMTLGKIGKTHLRKSNYDKAIAFLEQSRSINHELKNGSGEAATLNSLANAYFNLRQYDKAIEVFQQALTAYREVKDRRWEGLMLYALGNTRMSMNQPEKAIEYFEQAQPILREVKDQAFEGQLLKSLGFVQLNRGQSEKAIIAFESAVAIFRELKDQISLGQTLINLATGHSRLGHSEKAIEILNQVLDLFRASKDRVQEGMTLVALGSAYGSNGRVDKAIECFEQALVISRAVKDRQREALALSNLGFAYTFLNRYEKSIDYLQQALPIAREVNDRSLEGGTFGYLGIAYVGLSRFEKALESHEQALGIFREVKYRLGEGNTLESLGNVYKYIGREDKAIEYYDQALAIFREAKYRVGEGGILTNLGNSYERLSRYQEAVQAHEQALAIFRELKYRQGEGTALMEMGVGYARQNQHEKAIKLYEQSLAIVREAKDRHAEGMALFRMGELQRSLGHTDEAVALLTESLKVIRAIGNRNSEVEVLTALAGTEAARGNLAVARTLIENSLQIGESLRADLISPESRSAFLATVQGAYQIYSDLLMRQHRAEPPKGLDASAVEVSERQRARSLLDLLNEGRANLAQGVDPGLIERTRVLGKQLNDKAQQLAQADSPERAGALKLEIGQLETDYERAQAAIRKSSPHYAALLEPQPLKINEIQQLLDADTLLLEYALGDERSYLWAITKDSITSYELPKAEQIDHKARRLYELLTARSANKRSERLIDRNARIVHADAQLPVAAQELSRTLLGPVAARIGNKRLVIVADGALQYIPFAMLPEPTTRRDAEKGRGTQSGRRGDGASGSQRDTLTVSLSPPRAVRHSPTSPLPLTPLIVNHELVSLPSASALAIQRTELADRPLAPKVLAVIADPVFDRSDVRFTTSSTELTGKAQSQNVSSVDARSIEHLAEKSDDKSDPTKFKLVIPRLPFTRQEANQLLALAPKTSSFSAMDFKANRAMVIGPELSQYRYVHFATHGLLDTERPGLSSLVLSMVDEKGDAQNGFLRANDVYNMKLPAELVVLSACQTGLGKEIKGEGLVGLTRGFMYAGAARVVVSLWSVNDKATADLMTKFYEKMLKEGARPAAALRTAQVEMWKQKQWQSPYYWAAFTMQGEWR